MMVGMLAPFRPCWAFIGKWLIVLLPAAKRGRHTGPRDSLPVCCLG
jgi:hypothetical protein